MDLIHSNRETKGSQPCRGGGEARDASQGTHQTSPTCKQSSPFSPTDHEMTEDEFSVLIYDVTIDTRRTYVEDV